MVKFVFAYALPTILVLTLVTQVILPAIFDKPLFWFFKKEKTITNKKTSHKSLEHLEVMVDKSVKSYNESKQQVEDVEKQIRKIKNKIN